ncbi:MAG: (deoxy)nucleoside triphosphate pyrophosphohydrolase [Porticoccaceae bacterium]|nr:(deoxy)nucleoside triphosphate pyrophosphohydrolase [Porticoccaceae bacterium]
MKRIHVVAAIIVGPDQRIFISRRGDHLHQGGLWEFPGGKVEIGESPEAALARELFEEIDIHISAVQPYMQVEHDYVDKKVLLDIWQVDDFAGVAQSKEGQQCRWLSLEQLLVPAATSAEGELCFPAGNQPILERLAEQGLKSPASKR